ncbi:hypothetical protein AB7W40_21720, partial [Providencia rettgeri]
QMIIYRLWRMKTPSEKCPNFVVQNTPTVFLVEVNTLKTYPLLQGLTDMQDVMNRINNNLMLAIQ